MLSPVSSSKYYRPDGHPRPPMGELMAARMFERKFPADTSALKKQDFGIELIGHAAAEDWLLERAARCEGGWSEAGSRGYLDALRALKQKNPEQPL